MSLTALLFALATVTLPNHITLHYEEQGSGTPIIFVHGSLSDGGYWSDQLPEFAKHYRAIAYSRRYNLPNDNPTQPGYSAAVDADDLALLIQSLHLGRAVIVGHSYGALTALFLAAKHPELVQAMVLCEPPAVSLLKGTPAYDDIQRHMVAPMQQAFRAGDREGGVAAFIDYVLRDPQRWEKMPPAGREEMLRNAHEWDVMMTRGTLFPTITPAEVRRIRTPTLLIAGAKSYPFLLEISRRLEGLLPNRETIVLPTARHSMWSQQPVFCREAVEDFLTRANAAARPVQTSRWHTAASCAACAARDARGTRAARRRRVSPPRAASSRTLCE